MSFNLIKQIAEKYVRTKNATLKKKKYNKGNMYKTELYN